LQAGGNREGAGVEGEGLRDGAKSLQKGGNIQGCGEGGGRAFEHLDDVKKRRVLQHYINSGGQVGKSCRLAGISPQTHYNWLQADPDYKAAYLEAQERSLDVIEQEIIRAASRGLRSRSFIRGRSQAPSGATATTC
jgi:transposase-like protein